MNLPIVWDTYKYVGPADIMRDKLFVVTEVYTDAYFPVVYLQAVDGGLHSLPITLNEFYGDYRLWKSFDDSKKKKCVCGSGKPRGEQHSTWCDIYIKGEIT